MIKRTLVFALVLSTTSAIMAADFEVRILAYPKEVPQGAPVIITTEVRNVSGHAVTIAHGASGFRLVVEVKRSDGLARKGCIPPDQIQETLGFQKDTLPTGWSKATTQDIACHDVPGEWIVQGVLSSTGPYPHHQAGLMTEQIDAWSGVVKSSPVCIQITQPTGSDLEAWRATGGYPYSDPTLIDRYPLSTYAAFLLLDKIPDWSNPLFHPVSADEQVRLVRDKGNRVMVFPQESFEKYFQSMDYCLKLGNVIPSLRARLYGYYGDLLVQRGRLQEAEAAFKFALTDPSEDQESLAYKRRSQEFLHALTASSQVEAKEAPAPHGSTGTVKN